MHLSSSVTCLGIEKCTQNLGITSMLVMDLTHTSKESTCHMPKLSTCRLSLLLAGNTSEGVPLNPSLRPANKYYIQTWQTPNWSTDLKVCHVEVKRVQGTLRNSLLQLVSWKLLNTYLGQPLNITLLPSSWSGLVSQDKWIIIHSYYSCSLVPASDCVLWTKLLIWSFVRCPGLYMTAKNRSSPWRQERPQAILFLVVASNLCQGNYNLGNLGRNVLVQIVPHLATQSSQPIGPWYVVWVSSSSSGSPQQTPQDVHLPSKQFY